MNLTWSCVKREWLKMMKKIGTVVLKEWRLVCFWFNKYGVFEKYWKKWGLIIGRGKNKTIDLLNIKWTLMKAIKFLAIKVVVKWLLIFAIWVKNVSNKS